MYPFLRAYYYIEGISLKGIFNNIFNSIISTLTKDDREISDPSSLMVTALKNAGIGATLAYEAKFINKKIMGITRNAEKVNSKSGLLVKSHEISLTEYAKNLIEEFGFIPMGGLILPDGRKSWEISYENEGDSNQFIPDTPYLDIGVQIHNLNPIQFKQMFKGAFSQYFKYVKSHHNKYLGKITTFSKLLKLWKSGRPAGIIYKITQVKDLDGNDITSGPTIITGSRYDSKNGLHRIGRATNWKQRLYTYYNSKNKYHFENALRKHGPHAFKFEILAVCTSLKEYIATEYYWTLFYNKKNNEDGYDLGVNRQFNPIIGSWGDSVFQYNIPKYELVNYLLDGLQPKELSQEYKCSEATIYSRLEFYFKTQSTYEILKSHVAPYIDRCFRNGYSRQETLNYLKRSGILAFDEQTKKLRENEYGPLKRYNPNNLFNKILMELYPNIIKNLKNIKEINIYEQIQDAYLKTYGKLLIGSISLKSLKILEQRGEYRTMNPMKFLIIENLYKNDYSLQEIALRLGLCTKDDSIDIKSNAEVVIYEYIEELINSLNLKGNNINSQVDLKKFLKSNYLQF